jgi:hypothetical protein
LAANRAIRFRSICFGLNDLKTTSFDFKAALVAYAASACLDHDFARKKSKAKLVFGSIGFDSIPNLPAPKSDEKSEFVSTLHIDRTLD